jgi:hypothetical protein
MKRWIFYLSSTLLLAFMAEAQDVPFPTISVVDLTKNTYERDTSAGAVVLKEFGEAYIDNDEYHLIFKFRTRIKILNKNGLDEATFEIPLRKLSNNAVEKIITLKASSFNLENDRVSEVVLSDKDVFTEDKNKYWKIKKFAIPNVRVGSIIEVSYTLDSPYIFNFRPWEFQSHLPKIESEYWASIPGTYLYNITLRGFQKLSKNDSKIIPKCLGTNTSGLQGGYSADCALMKFGMKNIPAFIEEDYMTSKNNFISSIQFELSEVRYFDGRVDKVTKEWKDVEQELKQDTRFGVQLKKGKDIGTEVKKLIENETDELTKARKVYDFIKGWYLWNDTYGVYSELGIKKAFDQKTGNVGDINLSLVAAMRFAGLNAEPVILSTRTNGLVVELHPVLSDFNYVVAKVNIGDRAYLADATEKHYPLGMLPERCLNGKGRVIGERTSSWLELKASESRKTTSVFALKLEKDGVIRGTLQTTFMGYDAVERRKEILSYQSQDAYIKDLKSLLDEIDITGYELKNVEDIEAPLSRILHLEIRAFDDLQVSNFLFNPFFLDKWRDNPFKSRERLYPVDFGVPLSRVSVLTMAYPEEFELVNVPEKIGVTLPNSGGRFLFEAKNVDNTLSLNNSLSINQAVFSSTEYHYLKELFNRILQVQNGELIFKRKAGP